MSGTLAPLSVLTDLTTLQLDLCGFTGDLEPLRALTNLEELSLEYNTEITGIPILENKIFFSIPWGVKVHRPILFCGQN
jgi:hypothetical protein